MCGIAGILDPTRSTPADELRATVATMAATVRHRGPDAAGVWVDAEAGLAFAHQRLSIVDVSAAGAQPMTSASGRFVLSYNGEVYNAPELAGMLASAGRRFRGHSDTEVLLEAIDAWGLRDALGRAERHVGVLPVGPRGAATAPRPRPPRREAALLRVGRTVPPVRVRAARARARTRSSAARSTAMPSRSSCG